MWLDSGRIHIILKYEIKISSVFFLSICNMGKILGVGILLFIFKFQLVFCLNNFHI